MPISPKNRINLAPKEVAKFYQSPLNYIAQNRDKILSDDDIPQEELVEESEEMREELLSKDVRTYSRNTKRRSISRQEVRISPAKREEVTQRYMTPTQLFRAKSP